MSEVAVYQAQQPLSLVDYQDRAVARLADWAQSASAAYEVSRRLVGTSFCPAAYRGKPEEATAAILSGLEVGLSPMAALRAFDVIQGQAAPRAITLRAIAQSHGHEMLLLESTGTRCRMKGRRKGDDQWQDITWTLDRARDLGLTGKDGWKKQPQAMLLARATSELARLIAADAILGIGYSAEELSDGAVIEAAPTTDPAPQATGSRRMSRPKAAPMPAVEPEPEPEAPPVEDEPALIEVGNDDIDSITPAQSKNLHRLLGKAGITDRDAGLAKITELVGFQITSSKELTKSEASTAIDLLMREVGEDA